MKNNIEKVKKYLENQGPKDEKNPEGYTDDSGEAKAMYVKDKKLVKPEAGYSDAGARGKVLEEKVRTMKDLERIIEKFMKENKDKED